LYDELEIQSFSDDFLARKSHLRDLVRSPKKKCPKSTKYDEDTIVQLLKQGWSQKVIQKLYPIGNHKIVQIRSSHAEELKGFANPNSVKSHDSKLEKRRQQYQDQKEAKLVSKAQKKSEDVSGEL